MEGTNRDRCDGILGEREAIEFAVRTNSSSDDAAWIPLRISFHDDGSYAGGNGNGDGNDDSRSDSRNSDEGISYARIIRGYTVPTTAQLDSIVTEHVTICGDLLRDAREIQFRWMGTAELEGKERERSDIWALASVSATLFVANESETIIEDTFGRSNIK